MITVLFVINGLGLGNSTRCHAIIQRLYSKGVQIEVITSGNGLWYFSDKPEVSTIHEIEAITYGAKDGAISILRTFGSIVKIFQTLRRNSKKIANVLDAIQPDIVVSDSDYNFLPLKLRNIPHIALNNADVVWHSYYSFQNRPSSIRAQFFGVEILDYRFHQIIPNAVLSPCLNPQLPESGGNIIRIGPVVRQGYQSTKINRVPKRVAVMLSGSAFGTPVNFARKSYPVKIDVIGRDQPEDWSDRPDVTFHGKIMDTYPLLRDADLVVVNGGFSAVSEMVWMQKPLIVVPVPNHAEQWINAKTIENLGLGMIAPQSNYEETIFQAIDRINEFQEGYANLAKLEDGAEQASQEILKRVPSDRL